jgi:ATP-binding cassette subfamily B protein
MNPHMMMPGDASAVKGRRIERAALRRVWIFARPYRASITGFLVTILIAALVALVPPFVFRSIIDDAIPDGSRSRIWTLALIAVGAAIADAVLAIGQRWYSARIGEGLIYDLRVALFDKVQRMPVAFFTRTQTGSLISRLNNDVIGAQTAVTSTLGSVVSNVVVLVTTLAAMIALEWRLTLIALIVLPVFVVPARRVGNKLQEIARDFSGRAAGVRDTGIRSAMYGRVFFVALGLVGALGAVAVYGIGAQLVVSGDITSGTLVALAALVARVYQPLTGLTNARVDLLTSFVSFERVFEVLDAPVAIVDKPGAVDLADPRGRVELDQVTFRYPPASAVSIATATCFMAFRSSSNPAKPWPWWARRVRARRRSPRSFHACTT